MISIEEEKKCCGCGACSVVCPCHCITMKEKTLGHLFPNVNVTECINCKACEKVCPMINETEYPEDFEQQAFAAYALNSAVRFEGSSGGMFGVFSEHFLDEGGIVYGAAFNENLQLKCTPANIHNELKPLFKSKYLQCDMTEKYDEIKKNLLAGKNVLFVSTPCQVRALKLYLKTDFENLYTVDFFCHGVPSQKFFDQCLNFEEKTKKGKITQYEFRTKIKNGATPHYFSEVIERGKKKYRVTDLYFKSPFYAFFQKYVNLRESCYECEFAGHMRASDITIGDFHDIDKYVKGINRFEGVSTVILNSNKGELLWKSCEKKVESIPMDLDVLISDGACFGSGTLRPSNRDEFLYDYSNMSMSDLVNKWVNPKRYLKQTLYYKLPKNFRNMLKRLMGV